MNIKDRTDNAVKFRSLRIADVFKKSGKVFMKISESGLVNSVNLKTGYTEWTDGCVVVDKYEADMEIYEARC